MNLLLLELRRNLLQLRRYPVESLLSLGILAALFFGVGFGASSASLPGMPTEQVAPLLLLSYMFWMLCMNMMAGPPTEIETESQQGTIEQIFCSDVPPLRILLARQAANVLMTALIVACVATPIALLARLAITPFSVLMMVLAALTTTGFGLALGGVALLIKRTRALVLLISIGLMSLMFGDAHLVTTGMTGWWALPVAPLVLLAKAELVSSLALNAAQWLTVILVPVGYLLLGGAAFHALYQRARRRGTIGKF